WPAGTSQRMKKTRAAMSAAHNRTIMSIISVPQLPHIMCLPQGPQSWPLAAAASVAVPDIKTIMLLRRHHQCLASMTHLQCLMCRRCQPCCYDALHGAIQGQGSQKIRLHHVLLQHALGIEKGAIERDGMPHDVEEALLVAIEQWHHHLLEFVIERCGVLGP